MQLSPTSRARAVDIAFGAAVALVLARALMSCILADPPAQLPVPPSEGPHINQDAAQPLPPLLIAWPTTFVIPVEFNEPPTSTSSNAYVYSLVVDSAVVPGTTGNSSGGAYGTVVLEVPAGPAPPPDQCHFVEFDVSNLAGSDRVAWIYNPNEAFGACPSVDAGVYGDGAFFDMATEVTIPVFDGGVD